MADDVQKMGFDFSEDFVAFDKMVKALEKYNLTLVKTTEFGANFNKMGEVQSGVIRGITEEGQNAVVAIQRLRDEQGKLTSQLGVTNVKLTDQINKLHEVNALQAVIANAGAGRFTGSGTLGLRNPNEIPGGFSNLNIRSGNAQEDAQATEFARLRAEINVQAALRAEEQQEAIHRKGVIAVQEAERDKYETAALYRQIDYRDSVNAEEKKEALRRKGVIAAQQALKNEITASAFKQNVDLLNDRPIPLSATFDQKLNYNAAIAEAVNHISEGRVSLVRFQQLLQGVRSGSVQTFNDVELQVSRSILKAENAYKKLGSAVETSNKGILLSWQTMARLFEIQILHNMFGVMITQLQQGTKEAIQLSIRIGEIQTISQDKPLNTEAWLNGIRQLSDAYNRDLKDVAEGVYETLSNQVAKGAESIQFMNSALRFSIAAVATTADSVNLLTAAMNSYGYKQEEVEKIAASFFKTIDLGRVRASEMANTIGRILPTASRLGISLQEVEASIATLTISGVKYNEAFTLVQNVMLKLLKPSEEMTKTFQKWGVASGEAALAAYGFGGTLKKLEESAGGSDSELASMFVNIRAIRGALGLTGAAFDNYQNNLRGITDATNQYNNAVKLVEETPGFRLSQEFQKIKNVFTVDFGTVLVKELVDISDKFGGLANIVKEVTIDAKVLLESFLAYRAINFLKGPTSGLIQISGELVAARGNAAAFGNVMYNSLGKATVSTRTFGSTFGEAAGKLSKAIGPQGFLLIGLTAVTYAYEKYSEEIQRQISLEGVLTQKFNETKQQFLETQAAILDSNFDTLKNYTDRLFSTLIQQSAATGSAINSVLEEQRTGLAQNVDSLKASMEGYIKSIESDLDRVRNQRSKAQRDIEDAQKANVESADKAARAQLELNLAQAEDDPAKQVEILTTRYKELQKGIKAAFDTNLPETATKLYGEATEVVGKLAAMMERYKKAKDSADKKTDRLETAQEDRRKTTALENQLRLLEAQNKKTHTNNTDEINALRNRLAQQRQRTTESNAQDSLDDSAEKAEKAAAALSAIQSSFGQNAVGTLEKFMKDARDEFVKESKQRLDDLSKEVEQREIKLALLRRSLNDITNFSVLDKAGKPRFGSVQEAQAELDRLIGQAEKVGLETGTEQWKQVWQLRADIAKEIQTELYATQNKEFENSLVKQKAALESFLQSAKNRQSELTGVIGKNQEDVNVSTGLIENSRLSFLLKNLAESRGFSEGIDAEINKLTPLVQKALSIPQDSPSNINARAAALTELAKEYANISGDARALEQFFDDKLYKNNKQIPLIEGLNDTATAFAKLQQAQNSSAQNQTLIGQMTQQMETLTAQLAGLPAVAGTAIQSAKTQFDDLTHRIEDTSKAMKELNLQFQKSQQFGPPSPPPTGGLPVESAGPPVPHFASGGRIGQDDLIARFNGGEKIMNPEASRRFTPQLVAMNNTRPQHSMAQQIGDVHIHGVPISGNVTVDSRALGREFKRHLQRGTLSFKDQES